MRLALAFIFIVIGGVVFPASSVHCAPLNPLKKISVVETNNSPDPLLVGPWISKKNDVSYLSKLKRYAEKKGFKPNEASEFEFVKSALNWVTSQWKHDGMNQPPDSFSALDILQSVHNKHLRYRCVEYGIVLSDLLQSYGFIARKVALRSPNVAYGGFGQGHVAMEVWLNDLNKWIFLDPQFGTYMTKPNSAEPLNYYEIYEQKKSGKMDRLEIHFSPNSSLSAFHPDENPDAPQDFKRAASDYRKFLSKYFGFMTVSTSKSDEFVSLLMESKDQPLTFQGGQTDNALFTKQVDLLYPQMNRVALLLAYRDPAPNFKKITQELKIESDEDYLKNMGVFAAKPRYRVHLKSAGASSAQQFEYRTAKDGSWKTVKRNEFDWDATDPMNYVEARLINSFGRRGPSTYIKLKYE